MPYEASPEEMLPIDDSLSRMKTTNSSFYSEKMDHLILVQSQRKLVAEKINEFVTQLFLQGASLDCFSSIALDRIVSNIEIMLKTDSQVCVVGSWISLARSKRMDPIKFRKDAKISETLKKNASKYYVLTEVIFGGVFLGVGQYLFGSNESKEEKNSASLMSRLAVVSFISQGAVPEVGKKAGDINLWSIYASWKHALKNDEDCGYPIAFKCRELKDILSENDVLIPEEK